QQSCDPTSLFPNETCSFGYECGKYTHFCKQWRECADDSNCKMKFGYGSFCGEDGTCSNKELCDASDPAESICSGSNQYGDSLTCIGKSCVDIYSIPGRSCDVHEDCNELDPHAKCIAA